MTVPAALLCLALTLLCAALFLALRRVRRSIAALNLQIEQQRQQRAALDAIKDQLIANVSHELRTPLTSIRGALGLLSAGLTGSLDPKGQHLLRIALSNTDRLIRLVSDILDLERMESGQANLHFRRCSLAHLVQQAMDTLSPTAEAAGVALHFRAVEAPEPNPGPPVVPLAGLPTLLESPVILLPQADYEDRRQRRDRAGARDNNAAAESAFFDADPDRILQVLTNLLSNAVKFSPPGAAVTVHLRTSPSTLHLRVSDQGRGIPEDKLEAIFERFQQVESNDARQKGGTGLGLAICRTIVLQHGGAIRAERNPTAGATLCVDLPRIQRFSDQPGASEMAAAAHVASLT